MSAPPLDAPGSLSASGFEDGLGRRVAVFDRTSGGTLERLILRPELAAFERSLTEIADRLTGLDDPRIGRVKAVHRDDIGRLVVDSEFAQGDRLADLLEFAAEARDESAAPGVDVALGFLLAALPAVQVLHRTGVIHGVIGPARIVLTGAGQVVLVDPVFGRAVERLHFSRARLWREFGLALPSASGHARLDTNEDVAQVALAAVMLVLGRPLAREAYPGGLPSLLSDVVEIAQIRGSGVFASSLERFLKRALPLSGRRPFGSAQEAFESVRECVDAEMGPVACRQALASFLAEMARPRGPREIPKAAAPARTEQRPPSPAATRHQPPADLEFELSMDPVPTPAAPPRPLVAREMVAPIESAPTPVAAPPVAAPPHVTPLPVSEPPPAARAEPVAPVADKPAAPVAPAEPSPVPVTAAATAVPEPPVADVAPPTPPEPVPVLPPGPRQADVPARAAYVDKPVAIEERRPPAKAPEPAAEPEEPQKDSPRKKRDQSTRSKRDRLRSIASGGRTIKPIEEPPPAPQPVFPVPFGPGTPAAGEAPSPYQHGSAQGWQPTPASIPIAPVAIPSPVATPVPVAPPIAVQQPVSIAPTTLRIKNDPPSGYTPPRKERAPRPDDGYEPAQVARGTTTRRAAGGGFPWKMAAAAAIVLAVGAAAGREYLPALSKAAPTSAITTGSKPAVPETLPVHTSAGTTVVLTSEPAGARVLVDGEPAGETPLTLNTVKPGRRVFTLISGGGSVKRTVRVEAGKAITLDVPIFSGFLAIASPIVLDVSENGRAIGSTGQGRVMLTPGRHVLTLSNQDLEYTSVQVVEIEPGEDRRLTIEPRTAVSLNAQPWAEVWIDGKRAGETPLANLQIPLGTREIVFKHPQYGDRRVTATIKATSPTSISVDLTKPLF